MTRKEAERKFMRQTQAFHQNTRGWNDIGYNYVIFPSGRVYAGRGWQIVGAHTADHNHDPGICFAGNFEHEKPTRRALIAFRLLRRKLKISKGGLRPHCATYATSCPGKYLKAALNLKCER